MTHDKKIDYMKIAAGIVGYAFDRKGLDLMVSIYETVIEKEGKTDLKMLSDVESEVKLRDDARRKSELLDKVSDKVK